MNSKQQKTLEKIFEKPVRPDIRWTDIESLLVALGAQVEEGNGSRLRVLLNDVVAIFHRPHPAPNTDKGAVKSVRKLLTEAGIKP
jgi:hypothetical protein